MISRDSGHFCLDPTPGTQSLQSILSLSLSSSLCRFSLSPHSLYPPLSFDILYPSVPLSLFPSLYLFILPIPCTPSPLSISFYVYSPPLSSPFLHLSFSVPHLFAAGTVIKIPCHWIRPPDSFIKQTFLIP